MTTLLRAAEHRDRGPGRHRRARDEGEPADAQGLGRQAAQPGAASSSGRSRTPTATTPTYTLEARRDGEANWRPIATGKTPLTATTWDWNTETYPDGWYKVRVTSSDARGELARPRADVEPRRRRCSRSTTRARRSTSLTITYPQARPRARPTRSARSPRWRSRSTTARGSSARPPTACSTTQTEDLRIDLPAGLPRGTHTLAVRVADSAGNVGSTSTTFVIK